MTRVAGITLVAALLVAAAGRGVARAQDIRVMPVVSDDRISASFTAPAAFTDDALAVVQSGLLLTFRFTVEVRRPSGFWWDRTLRTVVAGASVKFDNLTGVYQVSKLVDEHVVWSDRTKDLAQVRAWMTTFDAVPVIARDELEPNVEYYLRVSLRSTPRRTFSLWPWGNDGGAGRADFTNLR